MSECTSSVTQVSSRHYRSAIGTAVLFGVTAVAWWQTGNGSAEKGFEAVRPRGFQPYERPTRQRPLFEDDEVGLPELIGALSASNARTRRAAVSAMARKGDTARPFVADMRALLADADPMVRGQTAAALVQVDRSSEETAAALAQMFVDRHSYVRNNVASALCEMGPTAIPFVLPMLQDPNPEVRLQAVQIAERIDDHNEAVTAALRRVANDRNSQVREVAIQAMIHDERPEISEIIRWMHDENPSISDAAIANLPRFGRAAGAAVPDLVERLESPLPGRLSWLLFVLKSLQKDAAPAIPALLRLLDSPVEYDIGEILETLIDVGAEPQIVVSLLIRFLNDPSPYVAGRAGELLARVDPVVARQQAALLARQLNNGQGPAIEQALAGLRGLGINSVVAMPQLIELLIVADQNVRDLVCQVLIRIGPQAAAAVPAIAEIIRQTNPVLRTSSILVDAAGAIGPEAAPVVPMLMEMITASEHYGRGSFRGEIFGRTRCAALFAVAKIGVRDGEYLELLHAALTSDSIAMRVAALQAISIAGESSADLLPELLPALSHSDSNVRLTAARMIVDSAGDDPQVVSGLARLLSDDDAEVRSVAAASLGRLGPAAAEAIPALEAARKNRENYAPLSLHRANRGRLPAVYRIQNRVTNASVAQAAEQALQRIAPEKIAAQR